MSLTRAFTSRCKNATRAFDVQGLNPQIIKAEYAVRGAIVERAESIKARMCEGEKFPFPDLVECNIGNPFVVGQKENTFTRQLIAACESPQVLNSSLFPPEVHDRARNFLSGLAGGLGAYANSQGIPTVRQSIANFIEERDGYPSDPNQIFLTEGASQGVSRILNMIIAHDKVAVMTPYPTYPLYTAEIILNSGKIVPYYLDEASQWGLQMSELERAFKSGYDKGYDVRCMVVINPGNPTGSVLTEPEIRNIIQFCDDNNILLLADEVYQSNIYNPDRPFISFKKVAASMNSLCQIVSFHSTSKGFLGECGHRGGYMELHNISDKTRSQIYKLASISLAANSVGQLLMDVMVNPPKSKECKALWDQETSDQIESLKSKAKMLRETLVKLPGMECQPADGAMYLFPKLNLPRRAIEAAEHVTIDGKPVKPDMFWALELLDKTGIVVVPGSGFGQVPGTHHFRLTFLPVAEKMNSVVERITKFQTEFMQRFAD